MYPRCLLFVLSQICLWAICMPDKCGAQVIRDSAGVKILMYGEEAEPEGHWIVGAATLQLGEDDGRGPQQFWNIAGVAIVAGSSLVVGDGGSSELRFFSLTTGAHIQTVAGEGRGPGEITALWDVWGVGDAIVAVDSRGSASYFDSNGLFQRRLPPPVSNLGRRLKRAGFFTDGTALAFEVESNTVTPGGTADVWMRIVALEGDEPRFLLRFPHHVVTRHDAARPWGLVFGPVADLVPLGDQFCVGFPHDYVIDCYSESGEPLHRIVRKEWEQKTVTGEDREAYFAVNQAANPGPRGAPYLEYLRENAQFGEVFPPFGRFVAAETGELWVGPFVPEGDTPVLKPFPEDATTWSVYSREGMWLSDVELPPRFRLMYAGKDYVAGVLRGRSDIELIAVLPLQRQ